MVFGWREAGIRTHASERDRPALLAALKDEQQAAERALRAKRRRQREEDRDDAMKARFRRAAKAGNGRPARRPNGQPKAPHHPKPRQG